MVLDGDMARSSQPKQPMPKAIVDKEISSDELGDAGDGRDLVSLKDIMNATDLAVDQFEEELVVSHVSVPQSRK